MTETPPTGGPGDAFQSDAQTTPADSCRHEGAVVLLWAPYQRYSKSSSPCSWGETGKTTPSLLWQKAAYWQRPVHRGSERVDWWTLLQGNHWWTRRMTFVFKMRIAGELLIRPHWDPLMNDVFSGFLFHLKQKIFRTSVMTVMKKIFKYSSSKRLKASWADTV